MIALSRTDPASIARVRRGCSTRWPRSGPGTLGPAIRVRWRRMSTPTGLCTATETRRLPTSTDARQEPTTATTTTRVSVEVRDGRHQVRAAAGLLRAQRLHGPADRARVALVGQTALLLGGDEVGLDVEVGPGAVLELPTSRPPSPTTGGGDRPTGTRRIRLGPGARLRYAGEPLVVSDGADVTRSLTVDLAEGAPPGCARPSCWVGRARWGPARREDGAAPGG